MTDLKPKQIGQHVLIDITGDATFDDPKELEHILRGTADAINATILEARFHHFGGGMGVTGFLLLAESHISIHTWPEYNFAALDLFVCGSPQIHDAIAHIQTAFWGCEFDVKELSRG